METKIPRNEELAQLVHPENQEDYTNEIARVLDYVRDVQAKNVKCLSVCIIESDPTAEDPSRVKAAHLVVGTKPQMAAMMASDMVEARLATVGEESGFVFMGRGTLNIER